MIRIKSIHGELEKLLFSKVNNKNDNISYYIITFEDYKYKIVSVKQSGIDLERIS